jgi:hypothetical protein
MKKAISILLALILCAVSCCAFADTLEVQAGAPLNSTFDTFKTTYDLYGSSNLPLSWESGSTTEGEFEVYTGKANNGEIEVKVYTTGGKVSHLIATGSKTVSMTNMSDAQALGQDIGTVLGIAIMAVYTVDGGKLDTSLINQFTEDLQAVLTPLTEGLTNADKLENGVAASSLVIGYPTGLEISATGASTAATISWKVIITSKDSKLNVK